MHTLTLLTIAVPALARTTPLSALVSRQDLSKLTVSEANDACGNGQTISCCNSIEQGDDISESDGVLSGIANGLLGGGLTLADGCSKLDVAARTYKASRGSQEWQADQIVIGVQDILNDQCTSNVACCQDSEAEAETGLVNVALPCVAIGSLVG